MKIHIENMTCGGCARSVTKAIQGVDPAAQVTADPPTRSVEIVSELPFARFEEALEEVGYPARVSRA